MGECPIWVNVGMGGSTILVNDHMGERPIWVNAGMRECPILVRVRVGECLYG